MRVLHPISPYNSLMSPHPSLSVFPPQIWSVLTRPRCTHSIRSCPWSFAVPLASQSVTGCNLQLAGSLPTSSDPPVTSDPRIYIGWPVRLQTEIPPPSTRSRWPHWLVGYDLRTSYFMFQNCPQSSFSWSDTVSASNPGVALLSDGLQIEARLFDLPLTSLCNNHSMLFTLHAPSVLVSFSTSYFCR